MPCNFRTVPYSSIDIALQVHYSSATVPVQLSHSSLDYCTVSYSSHPVQNGQYSISIKFHLSSIAASTALFRSHQHLA
jgi:hypothetical protein